MTGGTGSTGPSGRTGGTGNVYTTRYNRSPSWVRSMEIFPSPICSNGGVSASASSFVQIYYFVLMKSLDKLIINFLFQSKIQPKIDTNRCLAMCTMTWIFTLFKVTRSNNQSQLFR